MARQKGWTTAKRRRARAKANAALRERRRVIRAHQDRGDTRFAGVVPVVEYGERVLKLGQGLRSNLNMVKGRTAVYSPVDEAMAYIGTQLLGILRLNHIDQLLPEGGVARIFGLPQWPSENTEQRFLKRATEHTLEGLDRIMQRQIWEQEIQSRPGLIEVDGDVTGIPQRGRKREGVHSGYCGGRVRPCLQQPRITVNGLVWWTDLRPGNDGCSDLFERTVQTAQDLAKQYVRRQVNMRLDGYYASKANLRLAQSTGRHHGNFKFLLAIHASDMKDGWWETLVSTAGGSPWTWVNSTTQIRELGSVRPWGDETESVRAVAVRRRERPPGKKARRDEPEPHWDLRYMIVTNIPRPMLGTRKVFKRYHQRQREEFSFKDGKQSLSTAKMPTLKLMANRAHVKVVALAQNLMQMFARRFLPHEGPYGPTCKTIREKVIVVGGKNR
jgi:hypothetical protein